MSELRAGRLTFRSIVLFSVLAFCITVSNWGWTESNKLLDQAHRLMCASDSENAARALKAFQGNVNPLHRLPSENSDSAEFSLHAGTMDVLLNTLSDTAKKFPETRDTVENVLLQWSYCRLIVDDKLYDLVGKKNRPVQQYVAYDSPFAWRGFHSIGFLIKDSDRFDFESYLFGSTPQRFYEETYGKLFRDQCLPHPHDGRSYIDKLTHYPQRIVDGDNPTTKSYPYSKNFSCTAEKDKRRLQLTEEKAKEELITRRIRTAEKLATAKLTAEELAAKNPAVSHAAVSHAAMSHAAMSHATGRLATGKPASEEITAEKPIAKAAALENEATERIIDEGQATEILATAKPTGEILVAEKIDIEELTSAIDEDYISVPVSTVAVEMPVGVTSDSIVTTNPTTDTTAETASDAASDTASDTGANTNIGKKKKYLGLNGSTSISNKSFEKDGFSLGLSMSYSPPWLDHTFIRSAIKLDANDPPLNYSWGIGYYNWRKKTLSVQLNHWGPIKPGEGLDIKNAIASMSYNFGGDFLVRNKLGSALSITKKISGDPLVTWSFSWNPVSKWFVRSSFSKDLAGGDPTWTYGFGYANYSPFTWSLEYNNWGPNDVLEDNFRSNGIVTLTHRWKF